MLTGRVARGPRAGFTLIELLISLVLLSLVGGAIVKLLLRQQRFYNSTSDLINTRQQLRQAAGMLPSDFRGIASADSDISVLTDSALEFRSVFGSSVVCSVNGGRLSTVPRVLASGSAMTNWVVQPLVGDSLVVYNTSGPKTWTRHQITAVATVTGNVATGCPAASGLAQASDLTASNPSYQLTLSPVPSNAVVVGAAIRFFKRVRYRIFKDTDNQWYLGYYDCRASRAPAPACNPTQAIAGPFQPYAANATSGLQFAYYNANGAVTADPVQVARISLIVRGQSAGLLNLSGVAGGGMTLRDSLRIEVGLRNRQ